MPTSSSSATVSLTDGPVVLGNGIAGETLPIPTADPTGFHQAISEPDAMPVTEILGSLFLPPGTGPWPVVIVVPGSLGVAPSHVAKADLLTEAGIACCVIDPFGTRGVTSTVANQAQYSFAASAWDVLATAAVLVRRADVDATRIGAQGHSRGGSAVLSAACLAPLVGPERTSGLAAVYAAYPWSGFQFLRPDVGRTVVRSVIGDLDEWCLPLQVQAHMHAMTLCGCDASFRLFPDTHHSFDRDTPVELVPDASVSPGSPTIYIGDDGAFVHPVTGEADPAFTERDAMIYQVKSPHGRRGARIGTAGDQARAFHQDMMTFWAAALG
ncbi:MAG: prolyl oligopeptidase family serine peptidase [Holophagales bacterium]|nr:prolyl oligopeptidase family serine peptidase [Holophagales bacterium]MYF06138.1 prolyl oligopeptidase family serine peptidase [Holophagales bacterium]MYJ24799.1 prolyl oligopeptidase family serine peptidase [Holophagales bacterium]